jgi:hypothetical protein
MMKTQMFDAAVANDVHWFVTQQEANQLPNIEESMHEFEDMQVHEFAARYGALDVLKWLARDCEQSINWEIRNDSIVRRAVEGRHLKVVKWLLEEHEVELAFSAGFRAAYTAAVRTACPEMFVYLDSVLRKMNTAESSSSSASSASSASDLTNAVL